MNEVQAQRWNGDSGRRWVLERERHAAIRQPLMPHLWSAAAITPGERVLDVGCGCGETSVYAASLGAVVTGLDFSATMLAAASRASNVEYVLGDAQSYPLPEAGFDVAISSFGIMFFDDPAAAFANFRRGLRPGGRLAFLCWQGQSRNEIFAIPVRAFGQPLDDTGNPFYDPGWISDMLGGAGFTAVSVTPVEEVVRLGDDVADVLAYQATSPAVRDFEGPTEAGFEAMAAEYATHQRPDGVWVGAGAYLVTARRPSAA
ncbi:MAG TPA: class I SAM-dependent methyltransferase [Candidatus Limnocylindrales bacterium]|nr:class I SAM-dependent methyltransferase [Candidatus Limnocylindrales bacterium]